MNCAPGSVWMPLTRWRVVCAFLEVMLIFWPIRWFIRVDLPTLGRPTMATKQLGQIALHTKALLVRLAALQQDAVARQGVAPGLQSLLQAGLGVFGVFGGVDGGHALAVKPAYDLLGSHEVGVETDGSKRCLQRVSQNGWPVVTAAFQLALAQVQVIAQFQLVRQFGQGVLVNQVGSQARQLAFAELGKTVEQHARNRVVEDAVANELETFIIGGAKAAMRQCLAQQFWLSKKIIQRLGQAPEAGVLIAHGVIVCLSGQEALPGIRIQKAA